MQETAVSCPSDEVLAAWAAGALAESERNHVDDHAAECSGCRRLAGAMMGVAPRADAAVLGADGATIGRYRVLGPAGQGAMGVVLRGHDPMLDREVAIKMINGATVTADQRARMLREAQSLARLDHPNVVKIYDAGEVGDEVFVAMEYITGTTFGHWLATMAPPVAARLDVLASVGLGIAAVHAAGLVHRDVKPDNIVVRAGAVGVLIDFGLARAPVDAVGPPGSGIAGTPRFLAPEVRTATGATAASDQFAWWTVVDDALRDATVDAELRGLPRMRRALAAAIARGRATEPRARFATMTEAVAALRAATGQPSLRHPWRLAAVVAGATALTATAGLLAVRAPATPDPCAPTPPSGWSASRRAIVAARLAAAGSNGARILAALDARATATTTLRADACRATRASPGARRARGLRQALCLDQTWSEVERIVLGLSAADPATVREAVDDLVVVLPVERCGSGTVPATPEPPAPMLAPMVADVEGELRAIARDPASAHRLARLRALEARMRVPRYPPLEVAWQAALASAHAELGDTAAARIALVRSAELAEIAGDDDARARARINLLRNDVIAGAADTIDDERAAEIAVQRLGNPAITAELRQSQSTLRFQRGDVPGALTAIGEAVQQLDAIALDAHAPMIDAAQNLGALQQAAGDLAGAQRALDRGYALARRRFGDADVQTLLVRGARATNALYSGDLATAHAELTAVEAGLLATAGPDAAELARARGYLCEIDLARGVPAITSCGAALATAERSFGPDHSQLGWNLTLVGRAQLRAGAHADAIASLERALRVLTGGGAGPAERPAAEGHLALALHAAARDPARAARLARTAIAGLTAVPESAELRTELAAAFPRP